MKEKLDEYIKSYLTVKPHFFAKSVIYPFFEEDLCMGEAKSRSASNVQEYIDSNKNENRFQKLLFKYIDDRNLKDSEVYNKVGIDRRLFSKIRSDESYHPSKETVILLALALELNEDELEDLLLSASYSLPKNNHFDLIIRFCFKEKIFDLFTINEYLNDYDCKVLSC